MRTRKHKPHIAHLLTVSLVWLILPQGLIQAEGLSDNLVLYMPFDKSPATLTVYDYSAEGNNGKIHDDVTYTPDGRHRGAFDFDGYNDYVSMPVGADSAHLNFTDSFTIALWFKTRSTSDEEYIVTSGGWSAGNPGFCMLYSTSNNRLSLILADGSA